MNPHYPKNGRVILHVDMNSFYASVEMAYDPTLRGKPLAIAGNPEERRGIIVTCSYEARSFGVKTTMPLWEAKKLCPKLIIMTPNFDRYRAASKGIFDILREYSELVEPVSIDEGYVDITDSFEKGTPLQIASDIQAQIKGQLDLPCSIGVAPNKFLAKTASDMKKPMGITVLRKRDIPDKLWPLPVIEMHGIGQKTAEKLNSIGIHTCGDLAHANDIQLKSLLGINGIRLKERASGIDRRNVDPESIYDYKSVGNSTTLPKDTTNQHELLTVVEKLCGKVSSRLHQKDVLGTTIQLMIRDKFRKTITRSKKVENPIYKTEDLYHHAKDLFLNHWNGDPVRLLGVTAQDVVEKSEATEQLDLFSYKKVAEKEPLYNVLSKLQDKFGKNSISQGVKGKNKKKSFDPKQDTSFNKDFLRE
ncbi:DNA polymerase IV [Rossellomorea sp. YZS02]|uniref:DNA polymerase IV n=1 Tax=Rossellomorea sp. YZS02 TaxID=3097358 RepID=UPI002A1675A7|nr:DNA polymerase IV [Rossellomorea sp. YZS02]MDX8344866.1 DNA polymerase IV [Rossellomorea sp. YZS02]